MPTTRQSSAVTNGARDSMPSAKTMPSCIPQKLLCEICGKGFHHAAVLGRHRSLHEKEKILTVVEPLPIAKTFPCKVCGKVLKSLRTFGCHRCDKPKVPKSKASLKHEDSTYDKPKVPKSKTGLKPKYDVADFLKLENDTIPVVSIQNSPDVSETKNLSTEIIQSIKEGNTKKSSALGSKTTSKVKPKKDMSGSEISTVCKRKLKALMDFKELTNEVNSSRMRIPRNYTKRSTATKKSETGSKSEKKKGRKPQKSLHTCKVCSKDFNSLKKLEKHSTLHDPRKPYGCDVCGKFFDDARFVKTHRTLHEKKSRKECNVCGKVFNERIFFDIHCLTHIEQKPFRCDVCEDIFKDKTTFIRHCKGHKARTRKVAERFLSMKEVLKQKLEVSIRQN